MKIFGIICEYDPLHLGHVRHINYTKHLAGENGLVVCVMSGNFTQRGLPAIMDKYTRAKHAILAGADAVVELPTLFSTASATDFAYGGIKILQQLGATGICCGSECGDKNALLSICDKILIFNEEFNNTIKQLMREGENYPTALSIAENKLFNTNLLSYPNNLLAIEYLNSIKKLNSDIIFETLHRDSSYSDEDNAQNCSSSTIRKAFKANNFDNVKQHLPEYIYEDLLTTTIDYQSKYENLIPILLSLKNKNLLSEIADVTEGIENLLFDNLCSNFDEYISKIKSKRYTRARINRILLYSILNITKTHQKLKQTKSNIPLTLLAIKNNNIVINEVLKLIQDNNQSNNENTKEISSITQKADRFYYTMRKIVIDKNNINKLKKY